MDLYAVLLVATTIGIFALVVGTMYTFKVFQARINAVVAAAESDQREFVRRVAALRENDDMFAENWYGPATSPQTQPALISGDFLAGRRGGGLLGLAWRELEQSLMLTRQSCCIKRTSTSAALRPIQTSWSVPAWLRRLCYSL